MRKQERPLNENGLNRGSWAVLLLALAYIASTIFWVGRAFQQPSDGWTFDTNGNAPTAVGPLTDNSNPLMPGDQLLAVAGLPINSDEAVLRLRTPPPNWQIGQTIGYTVLRDGQRVELNVELEDLSFSAFLRSYQLSGNIWLTNLLWYLIGFAVFFLRPRDTAARLLLLFTTYWTTITVFSQRIEGTFAAWWPTRLFYAGLFLNLLWAFMFAMMVHFVLTFPVRKWPLTRHSRLTLSFLYSVPAFGLALTLITGNFAFYEAVLMPMIAVLVIALIAATAHNLWRIHDSVVRAQIGWVALGMASPLVAALLPSTLIDRLLPSVSNSNALANWSFNLVGLLLPICFGIAITRYRLFDIDVIIRKTLVYTVITGLLALVYFGSVLLLQNFVGRAAALLIAALFTPLRHRVQMFIDRRFYRRRYDAQQILARFAQIARDEVEMEALTADLHRVIQETMQPETVAVWLREPRS